MIKIDGKKIARRVLDELKKLSAPGKKLAAILAGDNRASLVFIGVKRKLAEELGVKFELRCLDAAVSQEQLEREIEIMSGRKDIGGVVVQLPLPKGLNRDAALRRLNPQKDVDNLTGKAPVEAPAVLVVKDILREVNFDLNSKTVAVVGRGFLVGEPVVKWLKERDSSLRTPLPRGSGVKQSREIATSSTTAVGTSRNDRIIIKTADINTKNLKNFLADADLIISGVGKANLINPEWLKAGTGVIDFGYPPDLQKIAASPAAPRNDGDGVIASPEGAKQSFQHLVFYTPTPGGTGPILTAELFRNFYELSA